MSIEAAGPVPRPAPASIAVTSTSPGVAERSPTGDQLSPAQHHAPTSIAAAAVVRPKLSTQRAHVLGVVRERGPLSDEELALAAKLLPDSCRPRRVELWRAGLVEQVGIGLTSAGRACALWGITTNDRSTG
jgi:hypothetical protein